MQSAVQTRSDTSPIRANRIQQGAKADQARFMVLHQMPLLSIKATCDLCYGMQINRATVLFGIFEPGASEKRGQLYGYALNLARQLYGMPRPMLLSGLCGDFPRSDNVHAGLKIKLHLMSFLPGKMTEWVDEGSRRVEWAKIPNLNKNVLPRILTHPS